MLASVAVVAASLIVAQAPTVATAASPCGAEVNAIACENQQPGTDPEIWDIDGAGDPTIQGFATDISVNAGSKIDFKIDTDASAYTIDIYRTGWYQGLGARFITSVPVTATLPQVQPECHTDDATDLYDCSPWHVSASWNVPSTAVSGVYIASLKRADNGGQSHIIFIVRNDGNTSDIVFQTSDTTWQAYNTYGGASFYQGSSYGRGFKLSYNRPFATRDWVDGRDFYFSSEYATVRFLERNGYDVSYIAGVDTDRFGSQLLNHKTFLSVGHDEYWSGAQRDNVLAARDAGVNLQFLSGNEMYWRTRWEPDAAGADYRTLVSYKETWSNAKIDPAAEWTGTWRDPRFASADEGGHLPENSVTGTMYMANNSDLPVTVSAAEGKTRLWRNTSLASLAPGTVAELAEHTVGYESNEDIDNGMRPAGLIRLSTTVGETPEYLTDYGNVVVAGTTTHHLTMYQADSGALVFSAGSIQWGWGLDAEHDGDGAPADARMQQAQVNLLADMGAQPQTLMAGLVAATKSVDTTAPSVVITSPQAGASVASDAATTVTGTASDVGGVVAGVEVSLDGGQSWHPASGTTSWSYTGIVRGAGTADIRARAIDDSANFSREGSAVTVTAAGPHTFFGQTVPTIASADDDQSVELGLRFTAESDGFVAGVRFYKGAQNTGTHTGSLWGPDGTKLGSVTFTGETATGWQTASFTVPIAVIAGQTYTVSYTAPNGGYAMQARYWPYEATPSTPLATASTIGDDSPGVFGVAGQRPTMTWNDSNYFVDVVFTESDTSPLRIITRTPGAGYGSIDPTAAITATLSRAADPATVGMVVKDAAGTAVAGTVTYDSATRTIRFAATNALAAGATYTVTPTATDLKGVGLEDDAAWTFTTRGADLPAGTCPCSLFPDSTVPTIATADDTDAVSVGVRFTTSLAGRITALRYFKGAGNTGTHVGTLWSSTGTQLATVTFADDTVQGWQTAALSTPVTVTAGQTLTVSYAAPSGGYSVTPGRYSASYERGPLTVAASGAVYTYSGGVPTNASTSDYGVDVVFEPTAAEPTIVSQTPAAGATDVATSTPISATFSTAVADTLSGTVTIAGSPVAGSWALDATATTATFTPAALLPADATVSVTLTGIASTEGVAGADASWSFQTLSGSTVLSFFAGTTPAEVDTDASAVELGLAFTTSAPGEVRAIRFYKTAGNGGTHTGTLWGPSGQRLATVTFTGESASGWQRAALDAPVILSPDVVYTVSYYAPQGHPAYSSQTLATSVTSGPLTTVAVDNGRFRYGTGGAMPIDTWRSTNYFVDVEFVADDAGALSVTSYSPANGATDVATTVASVSASIAGTVGSRQLQLTLTGPDGAVSGQTAFDASTGTLAFVPDEPFAGETTYQARVRVGTATLETWSFTTAPEVQTLFGSETPAVAAVTDTDPVEVGTSFSVTQPGVATAIRFYKGEMNTGAHRGSLWGPQGQLLAQVQFTDETASGWQRAQLDTPVALTVGDVYTVSYFSPSGGYAYTSGYFTSARTSGFITAPAGQNGLFVYGADGGYPTSSWGSSAYFVDAEVSFAPEVVGSTVVPEVTPTPEVTQTPTPAVTPTPDPTPTPEPAAVVLHASPTAGAVEVAPTAVVTVTFDIAPVDPAVVVAAPSGTVTGTPAYDESTRTLTFTPADPLAWQTVHTVTVSSGGVVLAGGQWTFTTIEAPAVVTAQSIFGSATPQNESWNDPDSVQVATRFSVDVAGEANGIRFYKGAANTGLHTGYLWRGDGTLLAQVLLSGETESGWQEMSFTEPVALEPGVEYRVGLHSTTGRYAVDLNGLAEPTTSGVFSTPAGGAAYTYSTGFPDGISNHNYWVDVMFTPQD